MPPLAGPGFQTFFIQACRKAVKAQPLGTQCFHSLDRTILSGVVPETACFLADGHRKDPHLCAPAEYARLHRKRPDLGSRASRRTDSAGGEKLQAANPAAPIGVEMAGQSAGPDDQIVIASVQSLTHRLDRHDPAAYKLVVCDEAHHAVAPTYRRIFEHFGFANGANGDRLLIGFTATSRRGDGLGLAAAFDRIVFQRNLREMITADWLVDIVGYRVETDADISAVHTRAGDFVKGELSRAVNTKARNELIVETYGKLAAGRKALVFTVDVQHAEDLAEVFRAQGVNAQAVSGRMPKAERRKVVESYRSRKVDVLCNCNLLTEGFDDPTTDAVLMARPTRSGLLYMQMLGRGTRTAPGKQDLLLLDFADATKRHSAVTLPDLFGLNPKLNLDGRKVAERSNASRAPGSMRSATAASSGWRRALTHQCLRRSRASPTNARVDAAVLDPGTRRGLSAHAAGTKVILDRRERTRSARSLLLPAPRATAVVERIPEPRSRVRLRGRPGAQGNVGAVLSSARWRKDPPSLPQLRLAQRLNLPVPRMRRRARSGQ